MSSIGAIISWILCDLFSIFTLAWSTDLLLRSNISLIADVTKSSFRAVIQSGHERTELMLRQYVEPWRTYQCESAYQQLELKDVALRDNLASEMSLSGPSLYGFRLVTLIPV